MRSSRKLLSLVICTYQRERELVTVLESLGEIPEEVEILVVDQNTEPVELGQQERKVTQVIRKRLGPLSEGRRMGLDAATGVFIGVPDDDNYYKQGFLEEMLKVLRRYEKDSEMVGAIANWGVFKSFPGSRRMNAWESLKYGNSGTIVMRKEVLSSMRDYGLAMDMSPGSKFPAGDETVLIANVLTQKKGNYIVGVEDAYNDHPVFPTSKEREMLYGVGMGGLAAKMMMKCWLPGWRFAARLLIGPVLEVIVCSILGKQSRLEIAYTKMLKRWEGCWKMWVKELSSIH